MFQNIKNDYTGYYNRQQGLAKNRRQASLNVLLSKIDKRKRLEREQEKIREQNKKRNLLQSGLSLGGSILGAVAGTVLLPGFGTATGASIGGAIGGGAGQAAGTAIGGKAKDVDRSKYLCIFETFHQFL